MLDEKNIETFEFQEITFFIHICSIVQTNKMV